MATRSDADIAKLLEEWHNIERCKSSLAKKKEELKTEINHRKSWINAKVAALKQRIAEGNDTGKRLRAEVKDLNTTNEKLKNDEEELERVHFISISAA